MAKTTGKGAAKTASKKTTSKQQDADARAKEALKAAAAEKVEAARAKFSEVSAGVERKVEEIRAGAGRAGQQIKEKAGQASEVARERYDSARESVVQGYDKMTTDLDQLGKDINEYVRHNPGKSVAMAAGIGFVLGLLVRGRRD